MKVLIGQNPKHPDYECDRCGACCIYLNVPACDQDLEREPSLRLHLELVEPNYSWHRGYVHRPTTEGSDGCPKLGSDGLCTVYATRPNCCELFKAGGIWCQYSRGRAGLGGLHPVQEWREE